jgi:hypothetical protein
MNSFNEMTEQDFQSYLKSLENMGCVINDWSYCHTDRSWKVSYQFKPTSTPEKIEIDFDKVQKEDIEELGLKYCEQCNEQAWDGRICHSCGSKNI